MRFTGHERDLQGTTSQTDDLDHMHARFYNPNVARFLSVDPASAKLALPQSWNRYSYALGSPLGFVDDDGREVNPVTGRPGTPWYPVADTPGRVRSDRMNPVVGAFGYSRCDRNGLPKWHGGADSNTPVGQPLVAAASGTVVAVKSENTGDVGMTLTIQAGSDTLIRYVHLGGFAPGIAPGEHVDEGQVVSYSGDSGNAAGGPPHVHVVVLVDDEPVDPITWLGERQYSGFVRDEIGKAIEGSRDDAGREDQ